MSDIIHLLPDSVANQIAAGEVIQRPASVVKELMENALDAGATEVHVLVTDAGKTCIQVIDNGKGMSETDARLSFERHATSKIREASDLFSLHTMGFRGEALASIAAVSEVELKTRQGGDELGTHLVIAGSKVESQEVVSCSKGCNFLVRNLFFNVPARRKFLKSHSTELSNVLMEFERIVLVHPEVSFYLYSNDAELFNLPATHLRQRIMSVFGKKMNQQLLSLEVDTGMVRLSGFIGKPDTSRKKGSRQYFFVNGRYMRHPYFHKAIMDAYEQLIPAGEQVSYFIYFEVDPANIDVNIHPSKTEIKFENEQAIWQILAAAVRETLGKASAVPSIDFDTEDMPDIPAFGSSSSVSVHPPELHYNPDFNPFQPASATCGGGDYSRRPTADGWQILYDGVPKASSMNRPDNTLMPDEEQQTTAAGGHAELLQFKGRFILTSIKSGLMIIDQHRAHVRVLFDRYMAQIARKQTLSQGVLFPEVIQLPPSEVAVLESIQADMSAVGFELTSLGGGSYAINGVPAGIEGLNAATLVHDMLHSAMEKGRNVKENVQSLLALTLARAAAIVYGQVLSNDEMANLVDSLFASPSPNYTPDGRVIVATIREEDIEKLFTR